MEQLTEVVSLHVAAPVVAVLICAFLVFLFGFKSPAQPPSFDFDDEKKHRKQIKKTKKPSGSSNGHAVTVSDTNEVTGGKTTKQTAKPSSPKAPASKAQQPPGKKETKKEKSPPKPALREETIHDKVESKQESKQKVKKAVQKEQTKNKTSHGNQEDDDGWTTVLVAKKDKKVKSKKEEKDMAEIVDKLDIAKEEKKSASSGEEDKKQETVGLQEQTSPKTPRQKKKKKAKVTDTTETSLSEPAAELEKDDFVIIAKPDELPEDKPKNKEEKPKMKEEKPKMKEEKPKVKEEKHKEKEEKPKVEEEEKFTQVKTSNKKKKKVSSESPEKQISDEKEKQSTNSSGPARVSPEKIIEIVPESSVVKPARSSKSTDKASTDNSKSVKQISTEPTMARSPKKSKNKSKSQIPENNVEKIIIQESSDKDKGIHTKITEIPKSSIDLEKNSPQSIKDTSSISKNNVALQSSGDTKTADKPITFDELGESWEEAKPKTKKKKVPTATLR